MLLTSLLQIPYSLSINPVIVSTVCTNNDVFEMVNQLMLWKLLWNRARMWASDNVVNVVTSHNRALEFPNYGVYLPEDLNLSICNAKEKCDLLKQKSPIITGHSFLNAPRVIHKCDRTSVEAAYRQFTGNVRPDSKILEDFSLWFKKYKIPEFMKWMDDYTHTPNFLDWLNSKKPSKRIQYLSAYDNYQGKQFGKKLSFFEFFYKNHVKLDEKITIDYNLSEMKLKSRNVTEQHDVSKAISGLFFDYVSAIECTYNQSYGSGLSYEGHCKRFESWELLGHSRYVCVDGSAFDSTQHLELMQIIDEAIYLSIAERIRHDVYWCKFDDLLNVIKCHIIISYNERMAYVQKGTTASGTMKTSNGNSRRSLCYLQYIAYKTDMIYGRDWFCETTGDDAIAKVKASYVDNFITNAYKYVYTKPVTQPLLEPVQHGLGQIAKIFEVTNSIKEAEYISSHFIETDEGEIFMMRKLDRFLQMTPYTRSNTYTDYHQERILNYKLLFADYQELLSWGKNYSLYQAFLRFWERILKQGVIEYNIEYDCNLEERDHCHVNRMDSRKYINLDDYFLDYAWQRYNITSQDIDQLVDVLDNAKPELYQVIHCDLVERIYPGSKLKTNLTQYCYEGDQRVYNGKGIEMPENRIPPKKAHYSIAKRPINDFAGNKPLKSIDLEGTLAGDYHIAS